MTKLYIKCLYILLYFFYYNNLNNNLLYSNGSKYMSR